MSVRMWAFECVRKLCMYVHICEYAEAYVSLCVHVFARAGTGRSTAAGICLLAYLGCSHGEYSHKILPRVILRGIMMCDGHMERRCPRARISA